MNKTVAHAIGILGHRRALSGPVLRSEVLPGSRECPQGGQERQGDQGARGREEASRGVRRLLHRESQGRTGEGRMQFLTALARERAIEKFGTERGTISVHTHTKEVFVFGLSHPGERSKRARSRKVLANCARHSFRTTVWNITEYPESSLSAQASEENTKKVRVKLELEYIVESTTLRVMWYVNL